MSLNLPRLVSPRFAVVDPRTGRPASLGQVRFYAPGTSTPKTVYADRTGETEAGFIIALDTAGTCEVFLSGAYRIEVYDANGAFLYSDDQINSIPVETPEGNPGSLIANQNLADLTDVPAARAVLQLSKQTTPSDTTGGLVMLNGGLGYGGDAPTYPGGVTNFNLMVLVGVWKIASTVGMTNVPPGAVAGILSVTRTAADRVAQGYVEVGPGGGGATITRTLSGAGWSAWAIDIVRGDFGLGGGSIESSDWDAITVNGFYRNASTSTPGIPIPTSGCLMIHQQVGGTTASQMAWRTANDQVWTRRKATNVWQPWVEHFHSGNLRKQSSLTDTTAGSALLVGAFGLGGEAITTANFDTLTATGLYKPSATDAVGNPVAAVTVAVLHQNISATAATQIATAAGSTFDAIYYRRKAAGVWQPWVRLDADRGSNANGEWVRFGDGTQICTHTISASVACSTAHAGGFRSDEQTWTFPADFAGINPQIAPTAFGLSSFGVIVPTRGLTSCGFAWVTVASQTAASRSAMLTAVGRWF